MQTISQLTRAIEFIKNELKDAKEVAVADLMKSAETNDIAWRTILNAKVSLPIETRKRKDGWYWKLPTQATATPLPKVSDTAKPEQPKSNGKFFNPNEPSKANNPTLINKARMILAQAFKDEFRVRQTEFKDNVETAGNNWKELAPYFVAEGLISVGDGEYFKIKQVSKDEDQ